MPQRHAIEVVLLEEAEALDQAIRNAGLLTLARASGQHVRSLSHYTRERQIIRTLDRCGLDSSMGQRAWQEYLADLRDLAREEDAA